MSAQTGSSCVVCGCSTDLYLCKTHRGELAGNLRQLGGLEMNGARSPSPSLIDDLATTASRSDKVGGARIRVVVGTGERTLPFHEEAAALHGEAVNTVTTWARDFAEMNSHLTLTATSAEAAAAWLSRFPELLAGHPAVGEMFRDMQSLVYRAYRVVDRRAERIYIGPCGSDFNGPECEAPLHARQGWVQIVCVECGAQWDIQDRRDWMLAVLADRTATSGQLVTLVNSNGVALTTSTIRTWVQRGKLQAVGEDQDGRPTYRVGDVLDVIHGRTQKAS